jgi:ribosome-binding protein aMBF1 (putative translation factor)
MSNREDTTTDHWDLEACADVGRMIDSYLDGHPVPGESALAYELTRCAETLLEAAEAGGARAIVPGSPAKTPARARFAQLPGMESLFTTKRLPGMESLSEESGPMPKPPRRNWADAVGPRIREAREAQGLSRTDLADLMLYHVNTLRGYEEADAVPWKELPKFADALGVSLRWLLYGARWEDPLQEVPLIVPPLWELQATVREIQAQIDGLASALPEQELEKKADD